MSSDWQLRREMCEVGRRVHARGLVGGTDGNLSVRVGGDRVLISPSGSCLGLLEPGDFVLIDLAGRALNGTRRPSSERWMHLSAYAQRPDIQAALHAHPPITVAFTVAGVSVPQCALPEVILSFGQVPVTAYATPATPEGAVIIRELIKTYDVLVLDRHGSLTVGDSPMDALLKLEKLEHGMQVLLAAHQLGGVRDLPPAEIAKLAALRESMGIGRAEDVSGTCLPGGASKTGVRNQVGGKGGPTERY